MVASLVVVSFSLVAVAVPPPRTGGALPAVRVAAAPDWDMQKAHEAIVGAFTQLDKIRWGQKDLHHEQLYMKSARNDYDKAVRLVAPHKRHADYEMEQRNLARLKVALDGADLAHACTQALLAVNEKVKDKDAVTPRIQTYKKAVHTFAQFVNSHDVPYYADDLAYYQGRFAVIDQEVNKHAGAQAKHAAALQAEQDRNARRAALKRAFERRTKARQTLEDADIQAFVDATQDAAITDEQKQAFAYNLWNLRREVALLVGAGRDNADAVAKMLGGTAVGSGTVKKKKIAVQIKAKKDHCYVVAQQFRNPAGLKFDTYWEWRSGKNKPRPQTFESRERRPDRDAPAAALLGACPLVDDNKLTLEAKVNYPGNKNPWSYVVVEVPRAQLPVEIAAGMTLSVRDKCDLALVKSWFTRPLPGTLVYVKGEPMLQVEPAGSPESDLFRNYRVLTLEDKRMRGAYSHTPPRRVAVTTTFENWWCEWDDQSAHARKIEKCRDKIFRKYDKRYSALSRKAKAANHRGLINLTAEGEMSLIDARIKKAYDKKCGPTEKRFLKEAQRNHNALVDELSESPPPAPGYDRSAFVQRLIDLEAAPH